MKGLKTFFDSEFTISSKANRMAYRLEGPSVIPRHGVPKSIISEPSVNGGVQIPPDGQPIILLVEQTVGGYTKIATVISADIPKVAQAVPGYKVRFKGVDVAAAHAAYHRMEARRLYGELKKRRILVRVFGQDGMSDHMRVTVGTDAEVDMLLLALGEIIGR